MYSRAEHFATLTDDLDPDHHRIICEHFFGIDPEELRQHRREFGFSDDALHALASETGGGQRDDLVPAFATAIDGLNARGPDDVAGNG